MKNKTQLDGMPVWFDGKSINEALFCEEFLQTHKIIFTNGAFFTPEGRVTDELPLRGEIFEELKCCAVSNIPRKISNIVELMKLAALVEDFPPEPDRIHLSNGTLFLDGTFVEGKPKIVRNRFPVSYKPNAPKPVLWLQFLDGLLYPEDIPTLQEYIGYCLIPSNKGQRMMVIKGNGGEGKSQIGAVLGHLFGSNMKDGSIGKISENRFARADLEHIYIDPPYNTGNQDFRYDDVYVDELDTYRHSKWLSFMSERLRIAAKLLAPHGFIFISIDDKEAAQLKLLCDEIFGDANYEKTDYIQVRYPDKTLKSDMKYHKEIEQVLVYRKSDSATPYLQPQEYDYEKFVYSVNELAPGIEIQLGGKKVVVFQKGEWELVKHKEGFKEGLKEIWATGTILNGNSSGRFFRDYLDGRKEKDGLKYYRTDFVPKDAEEVSEELLSHIAEMVQLENGVKLDGREYILVMSDDEA